MRGRQHMRRCKTCSLWVFDTKQHRRMQQLGVAAAHLSDAQPVAQQTRHQVAITAWAEADVSMSVIRIDEMGCQAHKQLTTTHGLCTAIGLLATFCRSMQEGEAGTSELTCSCR